MVAIYEDRAKAIIVFSGQDSQNHIWKPRKSFQKTENSTCWSNKDIGCEGMIFMLCFYEGAIFMLCYVNLPTWTVVMKKTLESPLDCKEIQPVHHRGNQSWIFIGRTDAEAEIAILWPPDAKNWLIWWCWERLKAGGEGDSRGWDGWMASSTQWTWVWVNSRTWWWTGKPGVLQSRGLQRVGHNWETEVNWTELSIRGRYHNFHQHLFFNLSFFRY